MKKILLAVFALMLAFCGTTFAGDGSYMDDRDVNEASGDDTMAYHIYIGKAVADVDESFSKMPGWERRPHDKAVRMYRRQGADYIVEFLLQCVASGYGVIHVMASHEEFEQLGWRVRRIYRIPLREFCFYCPEHFQHCVTFPVDKPFVKRFRLFLVSGHDIIYILCGFMALPIPLDCLLVFLRRKSEVLQH